MLLNNEKFSNAFACKVIFFIVAFYMGLWSVRVPSIKDQVQTDYLGIGYIIVAFAIGSVIFMIMSNRIIKYFSSRVIIEYAGYGQALSWILVPFITNLYYFMIVAFITGSFLGLYEIAMNLRASDIEKNNKKSMMSGFHAFYSLGLLIGASITSLFVELEISFLTNIIVVVLILLPLNIIFAKLLGEDLKPEDNEGKKNIFFLWPMTLFVLVLITITDSFAEGSVDSWSALYMRDQVLAKGFTIGLATIFFNIFMVAGRLSGDKIRDRLGVFNFLLFSVLFCVFGLIIIFYFSTIFSSIIGFSLMGIGVSNIIPLAYSTAGKIEGVESAVGISIISISAYGVFMIAPAFLGLIANYFGIAYVFFPMIILFLCCLLILFFSKKLFIN